MPYTLLRAGFPVSDVQTLCNVLRGVEEDTDVPSLPLQTFI